MSFFKRLSVDDERQIEGAKPNTIYPEALGGATVFRVVFQDDQGFDIQTAAKTMVRVRYLEAEEELDGIEIIKTVRDAVSERLVLSKFTFQQLRAFLEFVSKTPRLSEILEKRISLADANGDGKFEDQVRALLMREGSAELIQSLINGGLVTSSDIVNTGYRKKQLENFRKFLSVEEYWREFAMNEGISDHSEERVWQHFFAKNDWIFGYGLDYRFQGILQKEFFASEVQADGSEGVITDYLLGDSRFCTFVEIKRPSTPLFGKSKNRSNSWSLSPELIDAVSQILEQKASGQLRFESGNLFDESGNRIVQKAYDARVVLIVGDWRQIEQEKDLVKSIKEKTFELFRRDSRNIEILTFDELFQRANFIVEHGANKGTASS
jgi:hypothetical protein